MTRAIALPWQAPSEHTDQPEGPAPFVWPDGVIHFARRSVDVTRAVDRLCRVGAPVEVSRLRYLPGARRVCRKCRAVVVRELDRQRQTLLPWGSV